MLMNVKIRLLLDLNGFVDLLIRCFRLFQCV